MDYIQRSIELNGPFLLFESLFLIGGIALIVAGYKIKKKKSKKVGVVSIFAGIIIVLLTLYLMFSTLIFRLNS